MSKANYQHIAVEAQNGVLVVTLLPDQIREYDLATQLGAELREAYIASGASHVVLDFENINRIASVAYLPLVSLRSRVAKHGGMMIMCRLSPLVKEIFDTTQLLVNPRSQTAPFHSAPDVEAALALAQANPENA